MKNVKRLALGSVFILLIVLSSCSKKAPQGGTSFLDQQSLLKKLPATSVGFFAWDRECPAYQKFKNSQWGQTARLAEALEGLETKGGKEMKDLVSFFRESGLLEDIKQGRLDSKQGVAFIDLVAQKPDAGLYISGGESADFPALLKKIEQGLKQAGAQIESLNIDGASALAIKNQGAEIVAGVQQDLLAISSSQALVSRLFQDTADGGIAHLQNSANYKKLSSSFSIAGSEFAFGYLDLTRVLKQVPATPQSPVKPEDLPIEALAFSSRMAATPASAAAVAVNPKTPRQKEILESLSGGAVAGSAILKGLPSSLAAVLALDGKPFPSLKKAILTSVHPAQLGPMGAQLNLLDIVSSVSLGVGTNAPGSLFPDLTIQIGAKNIQALEESMKASLAPLKNMGVFMGDWQNKEISGVPTQFLISPMGLGLFLASVNNTLVLGSSETALSSSIKALQGEVKSVEKSLSPDLQKSLSQANALLVVYLNFNEVSKIAQGASGTLSMFSGGQPGFDTSKLDELKKLGRMVVTVSYQDQVAQLVTNYSPVGK